MEGGRPTTDARHLGGGSVSYSIARAITGQGRTWDLPVCFLRSRVRLVEGSSDPILERFAFGYTFLLSYFLKSFKSFIRRLI